MKTIKSSKLSFNSFDKKQYILDDNIYTLLHGHYKIK